MHQPSSAKPGSTIRQSPSFRGPEVVGLGPVDKDTTNADALPRFQQRYILSHIPRSPSVLGRLTMLLPIFFLSSSPTALAFL
jgi:hypothetical protein